MKLRDTLERSRRELDGLLRMICMQINAKFYLNTDTLVIELRPPDKCFCGRGEASHGSPGVGQPIVWNVRNQA